MTVDTKSSSASSISSDNSDAVNVLGITVDMTADVVIVGAGVIGATLALALAQQASDLNIIVLDRARQTQLPDTANLRATALGWQAQKILHKIGVWEQLTEQQYCAYQHMHVWDENSTGELAFGAADAGVESLGYIVDHLALQAILQASLGSQQSQQPSPRSASQAKVKGSLKSYYQCDITAVDLAEKNGGLASVRFSSKANDFSGNNATQDVQSVINTALVIAADGVQSALRQLAQMPVRSNAYQQSGIVATIATDLSHQHTAWQRFLSTGPLAVLPLANGHSSIVWSVDDEHLAPLLDCSDEQFAQRISNALQQRLGNIRLVNARQTFPLRSQRAERYCQQNLLLIGDAAHGIHPLAGQGANLGFADIAALLEHWPTSTSVPAPLALRRYERQRKADNYAVDTAMTALQRGFANDWPLLSLLRGSGMNWLNHSAGLKQRLAQLAMRNA